MKYIIEFEDEPMKGTDGSKVYRAKGVQNLVFDENGLKKLTPLPEYMSKYKPEREAFHVGDKVRKNETGANGYVLIPDVGHGNFIVMMEDYAYPQIQYKDKWVKIGNKDSAKLKEFILQAAELLKKECK